jgi:putative transposase
MDAAEELAPRVGTAAACDALGVSRATLYRRRRPPSTREAPRRRPPPARSLSAEERSGVVAALHADRFADRAPAAVYATLLDEGTYLCSIRTMYRILDAEGEARERRDQLRHPRYAKPRLEARAPNEVWTWDITRVQGPGRGEWYALYVVLDLFSRYVVGWMLARSERGELAGRLLRECALRERIAEGRLTVHMDRGAPMVSKPVAWLLADLGVSRSFSRPRVSDDNPFSESHFKTLKYRPGFPERFEDLDHARAFCRDFFRWYNTAHRHSGIGLHTPAAVHHGVAAAATTVRAAALARAYAAHPERFVKSPPTPPRIPDVVRINPLEAHGRVTSLSGPRGPEMESAPAKETSQ